MNADQWGQLIGKVIYATCWLTYKAVLLMARLAATLTASMLPRATSTESAIGFALLGGLGWTLIIGVPFAFSGDSSVTLTGFVLGGIVGSCVAYVLFRRGQAEAKAEAGGVELGEKRGTLGVRVPHVVDRAARVRHVAVFGATGAGKSTVIKNLIRQDAATPGAPGILCIDVKDDLVLDVAAHLPPSRVDDVLLFDPADTAFPPAFNPLPMYRQKAEPWQPQSSCLPSNGSMTTVGGHG